MLETRRRPCSDEYALAAGCRWREAGRLPRCRWALAEEDDGYVESGVSDENAAYIIYTSGSTGRPKGCRGAAPGDGQPQRGGGGLFRLTPEDRVLQFSTISDAAVEELFPTWLAGATLVLRPGRDLLSGAELVALVEREGLTVLDLPTSYWHEWVHELALEGGRLPDSLRLVVVGGEKASPERFAQWRTLAPGVAWLNTYGPTEGTVIASAYDPDLSPLGEEGELPIGRPIANARLYVLDERWRPCP